MEPKLAQVLNTLAHEIRTPLAVSQGYLKLLLDGRLTNADDARRAMEQTRHALGTLAALCADMGRVSAIAENDSTGTPQRVTAADFVKSLRDQADITAASWPDGAASAAHAERAIEAANPRDLAQAVAFAARAAFDDARSGACVIRADVGDAVIILAGVDGSLDALANGPAADGAQAVDFGKGGKGLKLIWAAFVLERHNVQTWTHRDHRASVGFRIPLVQA